MRSRLNVNKDNDKKNSLRWWHFLVFFLLFAVITYFLFPRHMITSYLETEKPNSVSRAYLRNMVEKYPENPTYKILLANQELSVGNIDYAESLVQPYFTTNPKNPVDWLAAWSQYLIVRTQAFQLPEKNPKRKAFEAEMKTLIPVLTRSTSLNTNETLTLASDATALGSIKEAIILYKRLITTPISAIPAKVFAKAGQTALFISDYRASADLYFAAQARTIDPVKQREYFIKALDSLQQGSLMTEAMAAANKHIGNLKDDNDTLRYLANLALKANHPETAQDYATRMLQLEYRSNP